MAAKLQPRIFNPKFPAVARDAGKTLTRAGTLKATARLADWDRCPPASHLLATRFEDAGDPANARFNRLYQRGESRIFVRFKPSGRRGVSEYVYFLRNHATAREVYARLAASPSPGEVLHANLVAAAVDYTRLA